MNIDARCDDSVAKVGIWLPDYFGHHIVCGIYAASTG